MVTQGSILAFADGIKYRMLVVSKDTFNKLDEVIACPIMDDEGYTENALHIPLKEGGLVLCEQLRLIDLTKRYYMITGEISINERMDITDAVQGIFDYV